VRWIRIASSGSACTSLAAVVAVARLMPISANIPTNSASSPAGFSRSSRRSVWASASTCSFWVETEVYSPSAIENAPATRPAAPVRTTVHADAPAAPTPATSEMLVTRPSIAPNTEARNHPPETSAWVWPISLGSRFTGSVTGQE